MSSRASASSIDDVELDAAWAHVRTVAERSGSSFLAGIRILPRSRREAMYAIYAYCREIDDIADDPLPIDEKSRLLAEWRKEIERLYAGAPSRPTTHALLGTVGEFDLRREDFLALIDGMEMDADGSATHGPTMETLDLYCDRVASAVGRLSIQVFGDSGEAAHEVAWALGRALQLTNILRDLREDADRGRLYLPSDLLAKHGIVTRDPDAVLADTALTDVCNDLAEVARQRFEDSASAIARCDRRAMRPATVMMHVYGRVLDGLLRRGWRRLEERVSVPTATKIWIAIRHGLI